MVDMDDILGVDPYSPEPEFDWLDEVVDDGLGDPRVTEMDVRDPGLVSGLRVMARAAEALRAKPPLTLPVFAEKYFFLPPGSSGLPGEWECAPFQRALMLFMSSDECQRVVIQKPARVGYTKMLTAALVYYAAWKKRSACLWQPIDKDVKEYVQDEIDPLFDYVPVFADALIADHTRANDPLNTQTRKAFKGNVLHFKPAKTANHFRRMTVDVAALDEVDGMDMTVRGADGKQEGSPVYLSWIRVTDSPYPKQIIGSTPTTKGASIIEKELAKCDTVLERYVQCTHESCKKHQTLEWGTKDSKYGMKWVGEDHKSARYMCKHCQGLMEWGDIGEIDGNGYWANSTVRFFEDENDGDGQFRYIESGEVCAFPESIGVKFSTLLSPFYSWTQMVREYMDAYKQFKAGDISELHVFYNTRLGETVAEFDIEQHDPLVLYNRREEYATEVPYQVTTVVHGIDVQLGRIEVERRGFGMGEESWGLGYFKLLGDTSRVPIYGEDGKRINVGERTVWDDLYELLRQPVRHPVYGMMQASISCIDSGYQTSAVYDFCRLDPTSFIPVKGENAARGKPMYTFSGSSSKDGVYLALIESDQAMDAIHARLSIPKPVAGEPAPGYYHWPINDVYFPEEYFRQFLAEYRVKVIRNGRPKMTWQCPPNVRNEPADTGKYCLVAVRIAQISKGVNLTVPARAMATVEGEVLEPTRTAPVVSTGVIAQQARSLNKGAVRR